MKLSNYPTIQLSNYIRGQVLIIAIVFFAVILVLAAALFSQVGFFLRFGAGGRMAEQASSLADAGVQRALYMLNKNAGNYYGDLQELPVGTTGTIFITVTDKGQFLKTIVATGYVPNSLNPKSQRTIKVDAAINNQNISFHYSVQVGTDGLSMAGGSSIKGNVYTLGNITGTPGTSINGDAYAVGTIGSNPSVTPPHNKHPDQTNPPPMPTLNYQQWRDAANINNDPITCTPTCTISSSTNIDPKKYVGNLNITGGIVTMNGPIYVTGNFNLSGPSTVLTLSDSFGSNGTVLIVDGTVTVNQGEINPNTTNPPGYILIASTSTAANAISIGNKGENAIFYALDGGAIMDNKSEVNALVAKGLTMNNNSELEYHSGLASAQFSAGPGGRWQIKKGTYKFVSSP